MGESYKQRGQEIRNLERVVGAIEVCGAHVQQALVLIRKETDLKKNK